MKMKMKTYIDNVDHHKFTKRLYYTFFIPFLLFFLFLFTVRINLFGLYGEMPNSDLLENPQSSLASEVLSEEGKILGKYYSTNRQWIEFDDISQNVIKALIATEDERFQEHNGIDFIAIVRMIKGLVTLHPDGGGSTLSMQLVKNLYSMRQDSTYFGPFYNNKATKMLTVKAKEWLLAPRLERQYSKKEIITMYLNTIEFVHGAFGIESVSQTYFSKSASELNIQEAAVIVGMLKNPARYNPKSHPDRSRHERNVVLKQLEKGNHITSHQKDSLQKEPLLIRFKRNSYNSGLATHFRDQIKNEVEQIAKKHNLNIYTDGLKVYTTINYTLQKYAEEAVQEQMKWLQGEFNKNRRKDPWTEKWLQSQIKQTDHYRRLKQEFKDYPDSLNFAIKQPRLYEIYTYDGVKDTLISLYDYVRHHKRFLQTGFLSVDAPKGEVKAWVGSINKQYFSYDHVRQGDRQPGSTFKPILYATAIKNGYNPCNKIFDGPVTVTLPDETIWQPSSKPTNKEITLKTCLGQSLNNCAACLIRELTPERVVEHAGEYGIDKRKLQPVLSLALGTSPLSLYEIIQPYATFVNKGKHLPLVYISRIEDKNGRVIYQQPKQHPKRVLTELQAYKMVTMLREGVLNERGTGRSLRTKYKLDGGLNQLGGKTGTSQNSVDGWFIGISNKLVSGCWVGGEINSIKFNNNYFGQGAVMALPTFAKYMTKVYNNKNLRYKKEPFNIPNDLTPYIIKTELRCDDSSLNDDDIPIIYNSNND